MGRTPHCSKDGLNRGAWTAQEDKMLTDYISTHGEGKWSKVARITGLKRCGKSCRLRWLNYLRPDIKRGNISHDEEELIVRLHKLLGNRWSLIAGRLPGRTDNEIKNYWNSNLAKKEQDFLLVLPKLNRTYLPISCYNHSPPLPGTEPPPLPPPHNNNNNVRTIKTGSGTEPPPALPSAEENLAPDFLIDINMEEFCQILDPAASTKTSTDNNVTEGDGDVTTKESKSEEVAEFPAAIFDEKYWDGNDECVQSDQLGGSEFMSLVSFLDSGVDW